MNYLICFDITDDKTRRKVVNTLQAFGERVQYSVFEVQLKPTQLEHLRTTMQKCLEDTDKLMIIPLCGKDLGGRKGDGLAEIYYAPSYYFIE